MCLSASTFKQSMLVLNEIPSQNPPKVGEICLYEELGKFCPPWGTQNNPGSFIFSQYKPLHEVWWNTDQGHKSVVYDWMYHMYVERSYAWLRYVCKTVLS